MAAPTQDGRLICVCNCAYNATADGVLNADPADIYYTGAGFLQPPATFVGGVDLIDACLVGTIPDGVVVGLRGTLRFDIHRYATLRDWLNDFNANPTAVPGYPGFVHPGFFGAVDALWDRVVAEVNRQRTGAQPLLVTGHSKGGAMAALAAWRFQTLLHIPTRVVTFEAAKAGNAAFRDAYNAQIDHVRYEYTDDIVPHLPPGKGGFLDALSALRSLGPRFDDLQRFDYEPVGVLSFIDWSGGISGDSAALEARRALSLALLIVRLGLSQVAADHLISCGSGCMATVCPAGVCPNG